jgi:heptosyltransferase III
LRRAFRQAVIDVLVFEDTAGILAGNPDIDRIVTMPARPSVWQGLALNEACQALPSCGVDPDR